jgi:transglutaminase/protease-like cytokinesis protein 3
MSSITQEQWNELCKNIELCSKKLDSILVGYNATLNKSSSESNKKSSVHEESTRVSSCDIVEEKNDSALRTVEKFSDKIDQFQNDQKITSEPKAIKNSMRKVSSKNDSNAHKKKTKTIRLREPSAKQRIIKSARSFTIFTIILLLEETRRFYRKKKVKCDDGG